MCARVCAGSNPLDHQVLDVSLPEYFPSAKRPRVGLCKNKSGPEESYSRGVEPVHHAPQLTRLTCHTEKLLSVSVLVLLGCASRHHLENGACGETVNSA